jgi:hypothetical protein
VIRWICRHPYTILAAVFLAALIAWAVLTAGPYWWLKDLAAGLYGAANASPWVPALMRRRDHRAEPEPWHPSGPSLPCPPGCRIRVEHRHDPIGSFR